MMSDNEHRVQEPETDAFRWTGTHTIALVLLCVAQVLDGVDVTVVNVALPVIRGELGFSVTDLSWVVNAYMVTFGGFLLLGGRAGDLLGRRKVFLAGVALFTVSSLVSGLAPSAGVLVGARAVQGLAAALIAAMTLALIAVTFPEGKARNRAYAIWGAAYGMSSALGLLAGGLLVNGPGWRWIFLVNVPLGGLVLLGSLRFVPADRPARRHGRFDAVGAITSTAGIGLLAYAMLQAGANGWGATRTIGLLAGSVVLLGYFVVHETRVAAEPLLPFTLFGNRSLTAANGVTVLRGGAMFALFYFATLYQQEVLGFTALETGLAYVPVTLILVVASFAGPALVQHLGVRPTVVAGAVIATIGLVWFAQLPVNGSLLADIIAPSAVIGLGFAVMIVPTTIAALTGVPKSQAGVASALLNVSVQLGGVLGLAALSTVATSRTTDRLLAGEPPDAAAVDGFALAFLVAAGLMLLAAVVAAVLFRGYGRRQVNLSDLRTGLDG